jgi:hypothetical protein
MEDLYIACGILSGGSTATVFGTILATRGLTKRMTTILGIIVGVLVAVYMLAVWNTAVLAPYLPYSSVVVLSNWFPLAASFYAGITWTHGYGTSRRRILFGGALLATATWSVAEPLIGVPPRCDDRWIARGRVCLQTSPVTCTAAAAATLLARYDISAEESEMARLCLTRRGEGTTWQGLYRGLKLKSVGTGLTVEVQDCDFDALNALQEPAILSVGLDASKPFPEIYVNKWGWQPGLRHSVVFLRWLPHSHAMIADPSVGIEVWSQADLKILFRNRIVRLKNSDE